jgi:hypothetical protein
VVVEWIDLSRRGIRNFALILKTLERDIVQRSHMGCGGQAQRTMLDVRDGFRVAGGVWRVRPSRLVRANTAYIYRKHIRRAHRAA